MTTQNRNDAAERPLDTSNESAHRLWSVIRKGPYEHLLHEALAAERRATVERIRERLDHGVEIGSLDIYDQQVIFGILDEEAAP